MDVAATWAFLHNTCIASLVSHDIVESFLKSKNADHHKFYDTSSKLKKVDVKPSIHVVTDDAGHMEENLALEVLKRWSDVNPGNLSLVPEHVETRSLYDPEKPGVEQVRLVTKLFFLLTYKCACTNHETEQHY